MRILILAGTYGAALLVGSTAFAADLTGIQVTTGVYCCTAPIPSNLQSNLAVRTVGPGVELPTGSLFGSSVIPISIDFAATTIDTVFTSSAGAAGGSFNGYLFQFALPPTLRISSATLNPLSTYAPVGIGFSDSTVAINNAALQFSAGSRAVIDVTVSAVPETSTSIMLALGIGLLWAAARRSGACSSLGAA